MKHGHAFWLSFATAMILGCACGGAQRAPASAPSPAEAPRQEGEMAAPESKAQPGYGPSEPKAGAPPADAADERARPRAGPHRYAAPPPGTRAAPSTAAETMISPSLRTLQEDFDVAETALLNAGSDCSGACRALRSMQRAAARLCAIASTEEDRNRCREAEARVRSARERVRSACGYCQGGPSLDPNTPIDSGL